MQAAAQARSPDAIYAMDDLSALVLEQPPRFSSLRTALLPRTGCGAYSQQPLTDLRREVAQGLQPVLVHVETVMTSAMQVVDILGFLSADLAPLALQALQASMRADAAAARTRDAAAGSASSGAQKSSEKHAGAGGAGSPNSSAHAAGSSQQAAGKAELQGKNDRAADGQHCIARDCAGAAEGSSARAATNKAAPLSEAGESQKASQRQAAWWLPDAL